MKEFWAAKNALMQKPDGDGYQTCRDCRGEGCDECRGWGWTLTPGYCLMSATGKTCGDCVTRKGCKR